MAKALHQLLANPWIRLAILLAIALILRCDTFGDPNIHDDEIFYQSVGIAMHHGALPYVDVWDRKPFGLFLIYYVIAAFSHAPVAYQLAAAIFAGATAATIAEIGARWTRPGASLLAGLCYLLWLAPMQGQGGQSPVFYNLFIAGAALSLLRAEAKLAQGRVGREALLAMVLAGCAITIKTTALFEAVFFGLCTVAILARGSRGARLIRGTALLAAAGAAPMVLIGAAYWLGGYGPEFWHAVVVSNLRKPPPDWYTMGIRAMFMGIFLSPLLILAAFGLVEAEPRGRRITALWLVSAFVALASVPRFYPHYALPLLVPLCVTACPFLARHGLGVAATAAVALLSFWMSPPFQFADTARSAEAIDRLSAIIVKHSGDGPLLVYDGPAELYHRTGHTPPSPLMFYAHLSDWAERDVSHLSTLAEVRRVLALRPGAIVMAKPIRSGPINLDTYTLVQAYIRRNCSRVAVAPVFERLRKYDVEVWGDCRR